MLAKPSRESAKTSSIPPVGETGPVNRRSQGHPISPVGSSAFGKVTSQANSARQAQLGLKLYF
jgi:hypothetical protein